MLCEDLNSLVLDVKMTTACPLTLPFSLPTVLFFVQKADMIVFPEDGIMFSFSKWADVNTTAEDVPDAGAVPCVDKKDHLPVLTNLSCMAKENQMYVVANLIDKKPCTRQPCPEKTVFYNTNVAFDRNGTLVSR